MPLAMIVIIRSMWKRANYGASRSGNRWLVAACHTSLPPYCGTIRNSVSKCTAGSCLLAVTISVDWYSQVDALFSCRWTQHFFFYKSLDCVSSANSNSSQHLPGVLTHVTVTEYSRKPSSLKNDNHWPSQRSFENNYSFAEPPLWTFITTESSRIRRLVSIELYPDLMCSAGQAAFIWI